MTTTVMFDDNIRYYIDNFLSQMSLARYLIQDLRRMYAKGMKNIELPDIRTTYLRWQEGFDRLWDEWQALRDTYLALGSEKPLQFLIEAAKMKDKASCFNEELNTLVGAYMSAKETIPFHHT